MLKNWVFFLGKWAFKRDKNVSRRDRRYPLIPLTPLLFKVRENLVLAYICNRGVGVYRGLTIDVGKLNKE